MDFIHSCLKICDTNADTLLNKLNVIFFLYSLCMFPLINKPTRITNHPATLIDNIFSNTFGISHNSRILVNDISDHLPMFTIREENLVIIKDVPMVSYIRNKSKKNMKIFCETLVIELWHTVYNVVDVNTAYNN